LSKKRDRKLRYREIRNKKVYRNFFVGEAFEAGIVLTGTEVKSVRSGQVQISDSFARVEKGRVMLYHAHIAEYAFGSSSNHNPYRPRELLLHKREIRKIGQELQSGGKSLVPTRMYFRKALIKVEIALCTGKKHGDKRQDLRKKVELREAQRSLKYRDR
jgi:SsrA-binding protein